MGVAERTLPDLSSASSGGFGVIRRDESDARKVPPAVAWIACQQRQLRYSCVGADEKIRQHSGTATALSTITLKHLACEKQSCVWNLYEVKSGAGKDTINILDTCVANRELRIHMAFIRTAPRIAAASS
jgi:hypothetical protein